MRGRNGLGNPRVNEAEEEAWEDPQTDEYEVDDKQKNKKRYKKQPSGHRLMRIYLWIHRMRSHFGDGLLLQIFFVYFTQGIRSTLCSLGTSYYLKETLRLVPGRAESLRATAAMPWIIKPVYGIMSDSLPIWGTRRKSYLLLFSGVTSFAYFCLSVPGLVERYSTSTYI